MNSIVFNPQIHTVTQWIHLYLSEKEITHFENIIDRTVNYLDVIQAEKLRKQESQNSNTDSSRELPPLKTKRRLKRTTSIRDEGGIQNFIEEVNNQRAKFQEEYQETINLIQNQGNRVSDISSAETHSLLKNKIQVCEKHLKTLKTKGISFYEQFLQQQDQLLESFFKYKMFELNRKKQKLRRYLIQKGSPDFRPVQEDVRILFDNLYIETEYLRMLIKKNMEMMDNNADKDSSEDPQIMAFKEKQTFKLKNCEKALEELKRQIREIYFKSYSKKKSRQIRDHHRLQNHMKEEIAINADQYTPFGTWTAWTNGFNCAFLLVNFIALFIFRQSNIQALEEKTHYRIQFTVWRGASYLIWFNWVCAVVFFVFQNVGINYRMILMEDGFFLEKYQSFIRSASLMTAIYLIMFLVYLLKATDYIVGYEWILNFGYYMWIINLVYLFNPLKILNYHSRKYFIYMFYKNIICLFRPMNLNIFFLALIIGSMAQPMNDLIFTLCSLKYNDQVICEEQGRVGTFVFMLIFFFYRIVQTYRLHVQFQSGIIFSRAQNGGLAVLFGINTVTASYLYGTYNTHSLMIYWIFSAAIGTLANINADFRADWGILSFHKEDCLLRKYTYLSRKTFLVWCIIDAILNVVWVLTISNALRAFLKLNVLYFFMVLAYIQLARKGIWMTFRIEDDHAVNTGHLRAMRDDSEYWQKVELTLGQNLQNKKKQSKVTNDKTNQNQSMQELNQLNLVKKQSNEEINQQNLLIPQSNPESKQTEEESPFTLEDLQEMVIRKKNSLEKVNYFLDSLQGYLDIIEKLYKQLDWNDEY